MARMGQRYPFGKEPLVGDAATRAEAINAVRAARDAEADVDEAIEDAVAME